MSKRRGGILPAIVLGTGLLAAMLPAQALAVIPEGFFESHHVKTVEAGGERGAAITSDGSLWIWGANHMGQLGDGTTEDSLEPLKIMDNVVDVSLGDFETAAVTEDGSLWMWGGDETDLEHKEIMDNVVDVELGAGHCAAITEDGSLYMWGFNDFGQVGDGTLEDRKEPVKIMDDVVDVATSFGTTLTVTADGTVWGWGSNSDGEVGDGTTEKRTVPVKVMDGAVAVSAEFLTSSALGADGSLWMWGDNNNGSIGDGTEDEKTVPVKVMEGVKQVSLGTGHTSAVAEDGSLWMWGTNYNGQLGNGTLENQLTPIRVMEGVQSVALGMTSTCVATEDGLLWTWGGNERGQLGDGTTEDRNTPARIQVGSACPAEAFEDVDLTMWYHEAIDWALLNDAMNGYENGTFGPDDPLAREQAAAVLWNLLGNDDATAPDAPHADVAQDTWYADAVNWAVENGYMNGYDGTDRFGVGDALTREQFACVIANAVDADLEDIDPTSIDAFPDADGVSDWAAQAVAWAVSAGVINGVETEDGRELQAGRTINRAEMAAMIMNAVTSGVLDLEGSDPSTDPEQPEVTPADEFLYERTEDGMRIVGYAGTSSSVTIPETIEGAPVTQIDGLHVDPTSAAITELDLTSAKHLVTCDLSYMNGRPEDEFTKDEPGFGTRVAIDSSGLTELEELDCTWAGAESLNITGCTALRRLVCAENYLMSLDLSFAKDLEELNCNENGLAALNITSNPALKTIDVSDNALTKLDTTRNAALTEIDFSFNEVAAVVDLSGSPDLVSVNCQGNPDVTLVIEGCTKLEVLETEYQNELTDANSTTAALVEGFDFADFPALQVVSIDADSFDTSALEVTGLDNLVDLGLTNGSIPTITVADCPNLEYLSLDRCGLETLNITDMPSLTSLSCNDNDLSHLDFSLMPNLTLLAVANNEFESLDLSPLSQVGTLFCNDNKLTSLDLSSLTLVGILYCANNNLTELDVSPCPELAILAPGNNPYDEATIEALEAWGEDPAHLLVGNLR